MRAAIEAWGVDGVGRPEGQALEGRIGVRCIVARLDGVHFDSNVHLNRHYALVVRLHDKERVFLTGEIIDLRDSLAARVRA